jgi:prolyl-tRNA editing enzyme YbaK/EbsC (Cys-tRNA(Pro) deacylase)
LAPTPAEGCHVDVSATLQLSRTVVDEDLQENAEVYIEAGDHKLLLSISDEQFNSLMHDAKHGHFCRRVMH